MHETWLYQHFDIYFAKTDVYPLTGSILNSTKQKKPFTYKSYVVSRKAVLTTSLTKSRALQRAQSQLLCSPGLCNKCSFSFVTNHCSTAFPSCPRGTNRAVTSLFPGPPRSVLSTILFLLRCFLVHVLWHGPYF